MARRSVVLALAATALVLTACSDEDDPGATPSAEVTVSAPSPSDATDEPSAGLTTELTSEAADAEAVVAAFYAAFAAGDVEQACDRWTTKYAASSVKGWNDGGYGREVLGCADLLSAISDVLATVGDPSTQLTVTDLHGELADDTHARVDVSLAAAEEPETYLLTLTAAGWLISGDEAGDLAPDASPSSS